MEYIKNILEDLKKSLNINEEIKIIIKPMKTKAASVSLGKNIIRINKNILDLGEESVKYLILHELVHIKLKTKCHTKEFYELIYSIMEKEKIKTIENKILHKLFEVNKIQVHIDKVYINSD